MSNGGACGCTRRRSTRRGLSGLLLALSFPKFGHPLAGWVALVPLLLALSEARSTGHGFRLGYITGSVSALGIVYWTALVVVQYGGLSMPLGIAVMMLLCLALALFPSLFGAVVARWARTFVRRSVTFGDHSLAPERRTKPRLTAPGLKGAGAEWVQG